MTEATLLIRKMPSELKDWLKAEAIRNHRSMSNEAIRLLEETRSLRDKAVNPARDASSIEAIVEAMQALPVLDARPMNEGLYDASGLPS